MGHSSKFIFPLPGRKQKAPNQPPAPPPQISGPLTKAQKILGTAGIYTDSTGLPADSLRVWESQSTSGISISVSETTSGDAGLGFTHDGWAPPKAQRDRRWEDESAIIPSVLNRPLKEAGSMVPDAATDDSSLRRRQSSSTIRSYYDKSKLPLSISQQTSSSAMAKGLPAKAKALLDIDGKFSEPPPQLKKPRKKPSRLDLSSLLPRHRSPKFLHPESHKDHVLGPDMLSQSPSVLSISAASTPPPIAQRADRTIKKKLTKESLRERPDSGNQPGSGKQHAAKPNMELYNLYDNYEQRTFADAMGHEVHGGPGHHPGMLPDGQVLGYPQPHANNNSGKAYLSPFPPNASRAGHSSKPPQLTLNPVETRLSGLGVPASPVSTTPADCASVSSRHTRTSKASKRTDRSLNEIDLLQNSVLALSSDSEDDYELSSKGSLAVPALSDGQASPTSPRSAMSHRNSGDPYDNRNKPVKRTSFAASPQVIPSSQAPATMVAPKISPRSSSLNPKSSVKQPQPLAQDMSRLSVGTDSTGRTVGQASTQSAGSQSANSGRKVSNKKPNDNEFDFPAPPIHRGSRSTSVSRTSEQILSPTTVDLYLQSQRSFGAHDNGSIRSGNSLGSAVKEGRRNSATSSINDGSSGRFMAVTRQEEMLLAALRMKRARMREDIIAEFEGEMDRDENPLKREMTNDSSSTTTGMSRQSSQSTMRQEGTLSARPRQGSQVRGGTSKTEKEKRQNPPKVDSHMFESNLDGILDFDDHLSPLAPIERRGSKNSVSSQKSASGRGRASLSAMAAQPQRRPSIQRRGSDQVSPKGQKDLPHQILEDPAEDEEDGVPRPDSPISPSDFPAPVSIKNNKQVRLSAVGFYKPAGDAGW